MVDSDTEKKVLEHYNKAQGSIQDIARVYRLSVEEVLRIIGQEDLLQVPVSGDLIDSNEAGPGAQLSYGTIAQVIYTTN